jgi:uncharacterized damage-inducible protein DinB
MTTTSLNALHLFRRMAQNNAWANFRLHRAISRLDEATYRATRTGFFPSIHLTLCHLLFVDRYYLDALDAQSSSAAQLWTELEIWEQQKQLAEVSAAQLRSDQRLCQFVDGLGQDGELQVEVRLERRDYVQMETRADVLLHLLQHQTHHRGQVHGMLSGTPVAPPQLDEFFLAAELPGRAEELRELGLPVR